MDPRQNNEPQPYQPPSQPGEPTQDMQPLQTPDWFIDPVSEQPSGSVRSFVTVKRVVILLVALLLVGCITVILVSIFHISKDDYNATDKLVDAMREDYISLNSSLYSLGESQAQDGVSDNLKNLKRSRTSFNERFASLDSQKAIAKDSDLQEQYQAIEKKKPMYDKAIDVAVESYEKMLPAITKFQTQVTEADGDSVVAVTALKEAFGQVGELKGESNKKLVAEVIMLARLSEPNASVGIQMAILKWQESLVLLFDTTNIGELINTLNDSTYAKFESQ